MRVVRERMRVKLIELPFSLSRPLHDYLASDVIRTMNLLPNSKSAPLSPRAMVRGEQTNLNVDVAPPFGSAVLCPIASAQHGTEQKNEIGICLEMQDSVRGGIRVYPLNRSKPVIRRGLKQMVMTLHIIEHMNEYAKATKTGNKTEDNDYGANPFHFNDTMAEDSEAPRSDDYYRGDEDRDPWLPPKLKDTLVNISYDTSDPGPTTAQSTTIKDKEVVNPIEPQIASPAKSDPVQTASTPAPQPSPVKQPKAARDKTPPPTRERSHRAAKDKTWKDGNWKVNFATAEDIEEALELKRPKREELKDFEKWYGKVYQMTLTKALVSEHHSEAEQAAEKELKQLVNLKTWVYLRSADEATPSKHQRETPCSMFLKPKYDARGLFTLWNARLVDGGHMTDPQSYDPVEKTSPTVCLEAVMALLSIAVTRKLEVESFDVPGAYLNATLKPDRRHKMRIGRRLQNCLREWIRRQESMSRTMEVYWLR